MVNWSLTKETKIYNGEKTVSSASGCWESWTATCKSTNIEPSLTPYTKINSKWLRLKRKSWYHKTPGREQGQNILWYKSQQFFLRSVAQGKRNKINNKQVGPNQTYKILHSKGNHKQNKKTTYGLQENIYKWRNQQGLNFQNIQTAHTTQYQKNNTIKKCAEDLNRHFSKEDMQVANRHMRCSISLIIREMQIETTMRYHLTSVRMAIIKKSTNKCWRGCGENGTLLHCWWDCKLVQPL